MPSSILNLKFKGNKSFVAFSNLGDSDSLTKTWKVCSKVASYLEQGQRLENLSWRLWHLQNLMVESDNAKSKREFKKLSKVMGDKLDKEKGRAIEELEAPDFKCNPAAEKLRQRAEEKERSRFEANQGGEGRPLKRMQFTFSVDQPASQLGEIGPVSVKKPDLKPSSQFRDAMQRRTRIGTRANANANGVVASVATVASNVPASTNNANPAETNETDKDPPSLTHIGRKATPPPAVINGNTSDATIFDDGASSTTAYSQSWNDGTLRFPSLFTDDFGPAALLFPQPSLGISMSYGEDIALNAAMMAAGEGFRIIRPTIELPLDEILNDVNRSESPGAWSSAGTATSSARVAQEDIEMTESLAAALNVPPMSQAAREALPTTIHPSQVTPLMGVATPRLAGKPSLTVKTNNASSPRSNGPSATATSMNPNVLHSAGGLGTSSAPGGVKAECSNCGATHTPLWRRGLNDELNCNACGLYCKLHKRPRPKSMRNQHGEGRHPATPRNDNVDAMGEPAQCYNCHTMATPLWRKDDEGKTVCNACGLYFKLHGSARPISMKSDVIRKRSRHDARRIGSGETPSASPGASRRASPVATQQLDTPILAPDSSTAQLAYNYGQEDYDFTNPTPQSELMGALGTDPDNSGVYSSSGHFDPASLIYGHNFPGPYHPDYLKSSGGSDVLPYSHGDTSADATGNDNDDGNDRVSKRRRLSVDSASEPPSSTTSYSSYTESSSITTASARSSMEFGYGAYPSIYGPSRNSLAASTGSTGAGGSFWHPPMMPQSQDKSPHSFVHPPMLPQEELPMDFLHPPMLIPQDEELFASYLHPPMTSVGEDSPMAPMSSLQPHPPLVPSDTYYPQQQKHGLHTDYFEQNYGVAGSNYRGGLTAWSKGY